MSKRTHAQFDFSGGEISTRMYFRADTEVYRKSLQKMYNFMPTLQGTANRTPGSRFVQELGQGVDFKARIIPFLTSTNSRAVVVVEEGKITINERIIDELQPSVAMFGPRVASTTVPIRNQIVDNFDVIGGPEPWIAEPPRYTRDNGEELGTWWVNVGAINMVASNWKPNDIPVCTIKQEINVDYPTNVLTLDFNFDYRANFSNPAAPYELKIAIGQTDGGADVVNEVFTESDGIAGTLYERLRNYNMPATGYTGPLYITITMTAKSNNEHNLSTPFIRFNRLAVWIDGEIEIPDGTVPEAPPYLADELDDIHFVQSPYGPPLSNPVGPSKPLVMTHPRHPPHWLYFNTDNADLPLGWRFVPIPFVNQPSQWTVNNYPATCSSFNGRLILAGALIAGAAAGDPFPADSETIWGTKVGLWDTFSQPDEVDPDDSIEFASIYRSPIQWVYGQKDLLVGALEMEYVTATDGIFQPADLGVFMQSTHGSKNVQPVGIGEEVLFPAEAGTKVRSLKARLDDQGWVSPDMTLLNPELCQTGIVRMVRMRNPHQMMIAVLGSGELALLHIDTQTQILGWSRINIGAAVKDACVLADSDGVDVLFLTVRRFVDGVWRLNLEAIANWTTYNQWDYVSNSVFKQFDVATNVITGLDNLEGRTIQVVGDRQFLGNYLVTNGTVTLLDEIGRPINVIYFLGGEAMVCDLVTLPPPSEDPGSTKRYSDISVRVRGSTNPLINGQRNNDRYPLTPMDNTQPLNIIADLKVANLGSDIYQPVVVSENIPLRVEILGIYGTLKENSL